MNKWEVWVNALVILIHAAKHVSHDERAKFELSMARHRLNVDTGGGEKYYHFEPEIF